MSIKNLIIILAVFIFKDINSQSNMSLGSYNTPFGGIHAIKYNPAEIVDSRYKFYMNLMGINLDASNNYIGITKKMMEELRSGSDLKMNDSNRKEYLKENLGGSPKAGYALIDIPLIGAMYSINHKHAIAIHTGIKTLGTVNNAHEMLARFAYDSKNSATWTSSTSQNLGINGSMWAYAGLTYGTQLLQKGKNYLKGAITLKGNFGLMGAYLQSDNLMVNFKNRDTVLTANGTINAQFGSELYNSSNQFNSPSFNLSNMGFGADIGFIYEKRDGSSYTYEMDCRTDNIRHDLNKYKYRIGLSVTDFGNVYYQSPVKLRSFTMDQDQLRNLPVVAVSKPFKQFDFIDTLKSRTDTTTGFSSIDTSSSEYSMATPSNLNVFIDYRIWKGFYLAANGSLGFAMNNKTGTQINTSRFMLTPRFETKALGFYLPLSYNMLSQEFNAGFGARLLFLNIGFTDILGIAGLKEQTKNFGMHMSVNVPILQKKIPKDNDNDLISNKLDQCMDTPGDCDNMGCAAPDQDGDGVPDKEDKCPNQKGPLTTAGCPDQDGDGIVDKDDRCPKLVGSKEFFGCPDSDEDGIPEDIDRCPKEKGPKELDGCPDRDSDQVPDIVDKCPDVKGLITNEGCPEEIKDADQDGIADQDDTCPDQPGPKSNKGCPEEEIEKKVAKLAQENLEFKTGSAIIKPSSFASLNMVAQVLKDNPSLKLKLEGHTDNVGKKDKNMKLSLDRAVAVKTYFQSKGILGSRISAEGFGPTKPKADNSTEAGRTMNRRVEIEVIK